MLGQMQDWPLRVGSILDHAARYHGQRTILSQTAEGGLTETDWTTVRNRALRFSQALGRLGLDRGDRIGVMAWNTARHMEVWYGVPGAGLVCHSLNPRLFAEQLIYIINHAENRWLIADPDLVPVLDAVADKLPNLQGLIILGSKETAFESRFPQTLCYEDMIEDADGDADWIKGEEGEACGICYTSGTTGNPKGVVYSHRSNILHSMAMVQPDMLSLSSNDRIMPVVPMFHANGWSLAYSAPLVGASMAMPGRNLTPAALHDLLERGVTVTAAVPTIWLLLLQYLQSEGKSLSTLKRVVIGGSSCPQAVIETFQRDYGVQVLHAWGMTETSPLGSMCSFKPEVMALAEDERIAVQNTVGHPPYSVDLEIVDDNGEKLPWNDDAQGRLLIRGPGVVERYLKQEQSAIDADGWFDTGDVATMDPNAYVRITDRSKDVIKSGGEWISSIDLENLAVGHADVAEAAAIGVAHPKWDERPVLVIVRKPGADPDKQSIIDHVGASVAKWQIPDDVIFVDEIPHTATGKISKLSLRQKLQEMDYRLPTA